MITSWELIMAGSHIVALQRSSERRPLVQVESRNQTRLVSAEAKPNDGRSQKQSKEKNGASRFISLPFSKPPLHAVGIRQKCHRPLLQSNAILKKTIVFHSLCKLFGYYNVKA